MTKTDSYKPIGITHSASRTVLLALSHALLFLLALPPFSWWPLAFLALLPLVWLAQGARSSARAIVIVFVVQCGLWLWLGQWLIPVTMAGYPFFAMYLAIYATLFVWIIRRCLRTRIFARIPMTFLVPVIWIGLECLRGKVVFHGYGWYFIAHPLIEFPVYAQSADLLGSYFVGGLAAMISGLGIDCLNTRLGTTKRHTLAMTAMITLLLQLANVGYGWWRISQTDSLSPGPAILVIQTNLPQDNKTGWTTSDQERDVPVFFEMTKTSLAETQRGADLIVWPETMVPGVGLEPQTRLFLQQTYGSRSAYLVKWGEQLVALSRELQTPILAGSGVWVDVSVGEDGFPDPRHEYNSAYLIQGEEPFQRYDKYLLTPFGETMPYVSAWPWLEEKLLAIGAEGMTLSLSASEQIQRLNLKWEGRTIRLGTPICFELTATEVCRQMAWDSGSKQIDIFINLSNDGWFTFYDPGREQHLQIARYRCIENRLPMIRAANTGLSVSIDSTGKVVGKVGEGRYGTGQQTGTLLAEVTLDRRETLYGSLGDLWAWGCLGGLVFLLTLTWITSDTKVEHDDASKKENDDVAGGDSGTASDRLSGGA